MNEKDSLNYARFWPRMNAGVIDFLFLCSLLYFTATLFAAFVNHAPPVLPLLISGGAVVAYIIYLVQRRKYDHLRVVDEDGEKPRAAVALFRKALLLLPLLIYILPLIYLMAEVIAVSKAGANGLPVIEIVASSAAANIQLVCLSGIFWFFWFVVPIILSPQHKSLPDYISFTAVVAPKEAGLPKGASAYAAITGRWLASFFSIFFIICQVYMGGFLVYNHTDRAQMPAVDAVLKKIPPLDPKNNFYAALRSINAPTVSADRYAYGLKSLMGRAPQDVAPTVEEFQEVHWQSPDSFNDCFQSGGFYKKDCPSSARLVKVYSENQQLITRYQKLYHESFTNYTRSYRPAEMGSLIDILNLQRFMGPYWQALATNGRSEEALADWKANYMFLRQAQAQEHSFAEREIWNMLYALSQNALLPILQAAPDLIKKHHADILAILQPATVWNAHNTNSLLPELATARYIFEAMNGQALFNLNDSFNRLHQLVEDIEAIKPTSPQAVAQAVAALQKKYSCPISGLPTGLLISKCLYNPIGRFYVSSIANKARVISLQYQSLAKARADILWLKAKAAHVTADDMKVFLTQQDKTLNNPLTNAPFIWNQKTHCLENTDKPNAPCFLKYETP